MSYFYYMYDPLQENWKQFAARLNGSFERIVDKNYFHDHELYRVRYPCNDRIVTVDVYSQQIPEQGKSPFLVHYTRVNAPFLNPNSICFKIRKRGQLTNLFSFFSRRTITTNNRRFNSLFRLSGFPEEALNRIFSKDNIAEPVIYFGDLYLQIVKNPDFADFEIDPDEDVLQIQINKVLTSTNEINKLHDLTQCLLDSLKANRDDVD